MKIFTLSPNFIFELIWLKVASRYYHPARKWSEYYFLYSKQKRRHKFKPPLINPINQPSISIK